MSKLDKVYFSNKNNLSRLWNYLKHASDLHSSRINFFLIAESMLILSFFSVSNKDTENFILKNLLIFLGFIVTISWFIVNIRISLRIKELDNLLIKNDLIYEKYIKKINGLSSNFFLTWVLPLSILLFWFYLFVITKFYLKFL